MWDTCTSHFGPKKIDRVDRGGQGGSKYVPEWASLIYVYTKYMQMFWLQSPREAPKCVKEERKWTQINRRDHFRGS